MNRIIKNTIFKLFVIVVAFTVYSASAEDAPVAEPDHYTVVFENDRVRVLRANYQPGEKSSMHTHKAGLVIIPTGSHELFTFPDGNTVEIVNEPNAVVWSEAIEHTAEMLGPNPVEAFVVELKD